VLWNAPELPEPIRNATAMRFLWLLVFMTLAYSCFGGIFLVVLEPRSWTRFAGLTMGLIGAGLGGWLGWSGKPWAGLNVACACIIVGLGYALIHNGGSDAPAFFACVPFVTSLVFAYGPRAALAFEAALEKSRALLAEANTELERKVADRTAALEASNRELEAFAYSVSHDLRAPLRALDGFAHALGEDYGGVLPPRGRGYLERIRAATRRMGELIDCLLDLSRITRAELHREDVDLSSLAASVGDELARANAGRAVELVIEPGLRARADPRLLGVVLTNLLANAWKFTSKTPAARVAVGSARDAQGALSFYVKDNGAGFDPRHASRLFGAFQRLHAATDFPGTGIGLATVQRVVQRHGGRVWAEGSPGAGATFFFTLEARPETGSL
jgi:signal transduction histidine kinase